MYKIYWSIVICSILSAVSCQNNNAVESGKDNKPAAEVHGEHESEDPNLAILTHEQMKSIGIELGVIEQKQLTSSLKTNGVLKVPNQNKASVNSLYSGVIKTLLVQPGNIVKKGQAIATIANPDFIQAQSEYLKVNTRIAMSELEVKRQKELNAGNAGSLKNLQSAETELRTLRTLKETLQQQIRMMGIDPSRLTNGKLISVVTLTSPINGVVSNVMVKMGGYVDVTTPVADIVDNSSLHLDLYVYEKDLPKIKANQTIHFTITNNPGKEYDAEIFSLGSSFEGASKTVSVHAKVQGDKTGLIDGMNVTAVISLDKAVVPAVPNESIVTVEGQDYIFVLQPNNVPHQEHESKDSNHVEKNDTHKEESEGVTFVRVPVARGGSDIGYTEMTALKPIPKNAQIVVKNAFFVSAKMTNTEGHEH